MRCTGFGSVGIVDAGRWVWREGDVRVGGKEDLKSRFRRQLWILTWKWE